MITGNVCEAHLLPDCPACARILAGSMTDDGACLGCTEYATRGLHRAACPHRIAGGVIQPQAPMLESPTIGGGPADAYPLKGWRRAELIRELALGKATQTELGRRYYVTQQAIAAFAKRHADAIEVARANLEDQFSALWIAQQRARVAEYQEDVEMLNDRIEASLAPTINEDGVTVIESADAFDALPHKHRALRAVAEELGQLPNRTTVSHTGEVKVNYEIAGVDLNDLK